MNSEPLIHAPAADDITEPADAAASAHTFSTGIGAASGGATGAAIGLAVGGPVGAVVGAVIGAVAGGVGGNALSSNFQAGEERQMQADPKARALPSQSEIASRAWTHFEERRKADGHDLDDWLRAERDLSKETRGSDSDASTF